MCDNYLTMYYQNCRGVRTKLGILYMNILSNCYDIIVLTETWLMPNILVSEFIDDRYIVYRCDRDPVATGKKDGGETLVAVLRGLHSTRIAPHATLHANIEHVLLRIPSSNKGQYHYISAVYIPPKTPENVYEIYFDMLSIYLSNSDVENLYLIGDYNLPDIEWVTDTRSSSGKFCAGRSAVCTMLSSFLSAHNALQYNTFKNITTKILDLFISDNDDCVLQMASNELVPSDVYHPPFYVMIPCSLKINTMNRNLVKRYNYFKADYEKINEELSQVDWEGLFVNNSVDESVDIFYNIVFRIIKTHVPLTTVKSSKFPIWFSSALIHIFKNKSKAWIKWKKYKNVSDYEQFSIYRSRFQVECRNCYSRHIYAVEDSIKNNVKYFWKFISSRKSSNGYPATMHFKDQSTSNPDEICNLFSIFFKSVYETSALKYGELSFSDEYTDNAPLINKLKFTLKQTMNALQSLDVTKGPGPDALPVLFLKKTIENICIPLQIIFNRSLQEGIFPSIWKQANITPVYKSGPKDDVENYRPISILSALAKLFERLVHNEIYPLLHSIIAKEQHGFVQRRSTVTNLIAYTDYLFNSMDSGTQVDSVYTDFRKAFDKVDHVLLMKKLAYNGIRGDLLRWFASYVTNRTQKVVVNGYQSFSISVTSGVPQGSILGPLLFILFVNDIDGCFRYSKFLMYADDLKIYRSIRDTNDCYKLQDDLNRFSQYCINNKLQLSISKCCCISFTKNKANLKYHYCINDIPLNRVSLIRDLGVVIDDKLHLNTHINTIVNNAWRMFGFVLRSSTNFVRPQTYLHLYKTLIRSQLEYAVAVWNPLYNKYSDCMERVQKKFLKALQYKCSRTYLSYPDLLKKYNLLSLYSRRIFLETMLLYDFCNSTYDCLDICNRICYAVPRSAQTRAVRKQSLFAVSSSRTNAGMRAPLRRLPNNYNKHFSNIDFFCLSHGKCKRAILEVLNQNQPY